MPTPHFLTRTRFAIIAALIGASGIHCEAEPEMGVYRWANGTANVDAFAAWLSRDTVWGLDFVGGETWSNVGWPVWWLESWSKWTKAKPGRRLILSIPILAGPVDGSGPKQGEVGVNVPVSLEKGAAGDYNIHFQQLAENLVKFGLADCVLRPAWEFNGNWYTWRAKDKTEAFAAYWRQIVKTMRAVPGTEKLRFCWNPTLGEQDFPAEQAWPGDEYVDFVGVDVYDETWAADTYPLPVGATDAEIARRQNNAWNTWTMNSPRGLAFWVKFAATHGKPLAIPEWGVVEANHGHCGQDDPIFIEKMHAFINDPANRVAWHCYFDVNTPDHYHQLSPGQGEHGETVTLKFPRSSALFRQLFRQPSK